MSPRLSTLRHGVPVYRFDPAPGVPPVSLVHLGNHNHPGDGRRHIHDFPLLMLAGSEVVILAPGRVVDPTGVHIEGTAKAVLFDPAAFDAELLRPFREMRRLPIPGDRLEFWRSTVAAIERELEASRHAVVAHGTLLLVELGRMIPAEPAEPSVEAAFEVIEARYAETLSLRDVAAAVGLTPGYLTTVIRRRTGRTVQQWITEYRIAAAKRLLADGSIPVADVGRRVGFPDPAYFSRLFRREMGATPTAWRSGTQRPDAV